MSHSNRSELQLETFGTGFVNIFAKLEAILLSLVSTWPSKKIGWLGSWGFLLLDRSLSSFECLLDACLIEQDSTLSFYCGTFLWMIRKLIRRFWYQIGQFVLRCLALPSVSLYIL